MKSNDKPFRIYKLDMYFSNNIIANKKNPLELLYKISDIADIVEANTNVSNLPALDEIDVNNFYISWTIIVRTKTLKSELNDIFASYEKISKIKIEEYDEDYLSYVSDALMGNKIGEVLIEKGLISEGEIKTALQGQKRLGEILIEAGLITAEQIEVALKHQKKLGQILIESGKIVPSKVLTIIEQQKQVREYKETNMIKVDICKIDNLMSMVNKLSIVHKDIEKGVNDLSNENIKGNLKLSEDLITEIKRIINNCRNAT